MRRSPEFDSLSEPTVAEIIARCADVIDEDDIWFLETEVGEDTDLAMFYLLGVFEERGIDPETYLLEKGLATAVQPWRESCELE